MIYLSFEFYIFVIAAVILYYLFPRRVRWIVLLAASCGFYYYNFREGVPVILATAAVSYAGGLGVYYLKKKPLLRKLVLAAAIILTLLPWLYIKNVNLFAADKLADGTLSIVVPVGISFYTLQIIAYLADIYKGKIRALRNPLKYLLFVTFFPQIIQGPIPRYADLGKQLIYGNALDDRKFRKGFYYILWGFFLKLCIADKISILSTAILGSYEDYKGILMWIGVICAVIYLYTDFLACTTLAQGVAFLFGIRLSDNFRRPFFSQTFSEFWRRWHMSLSFWLRDYVYIPLGGNRKGAFRKYLNIFIVFVLCGLWHGSAWHFILWGAVIGIAQMVGGITLPYREKVYAYFNIPEDHFGKRLVRTVGTSFLFMLTFLFYQMETPEAALTVISNMFAEFNPWVLFDDSLLGFGLGIKELLVLILALVIFFVVEIAQESGHMLSDALVGTAFPIRWAVCIIAIVFIMIFGTYGYGFNAADFIYGGF